MIFQDPYSSLDPRKTASYSIEEAMKVHGMGEDSRERHQRALEALQEVGLDIQHMERYPHEFSGGQRQRVNIARALSISPKVIVCDEPVSALDVSIQAQVINLFKKIQQERKLTYVFISHDLGIIKYISDRIIIMYQPHRRSDRLSLGGPLPQLYGAVQKRDPQTGGCGRPPHGGLLPVRIKHPNTDGIFLYKQSRDRKRGGVFREQSRAAGADDSKTQRTDI